MTHSLSISNKLSRLRARMKEAEWQKYGALLLTGKLTGLLRSRW